LLFHFIRKSFTNQKKAMALMILSVAVGTAIAASLITLSLEISGKVSRELRAFGANILIAPSVEGLADISGQKRYLRQADIVKAKTIFWRHNILGLAPFLEAQAVISGAEGEEVVIVGTWNEQKLSVPGEKEKFLAGIQTVSPWWEIDGSWPSSDREVVVGSSLAVRHGLAQGNGIRLDNVPFTITGILDTGGKEDTRIFMEIKALQQFKKLSGKVSRVLVSALSKPMDEFAYRNPDTMSQTEYEKWYCTGYITSIAKQLEEVFTGSTARPIWHVAETEGKILSKLQILIYLCSIIAVVASALGVSTTMVMSSLRRVDEIGLMKSLGADSSKVIAVFLSEAVMTGIAGGLIGYLISLFLSGHIGMQVFQSGLAQRSILFPISLGSAVIIAVLGSVLPIRRALKIQPALVMKGAE
jgi:putative ABC transport system permease protein